MKIKVFFFVFFLLASLGSIHAQTSTSTMDNQILKETLVAISGLVEGHAGNWEVYYGGRVLFVLADEKANRMRIFAPITEADNLDRQELRKLLEANFHSALDAKYSLYEDHVISVFTHPLKELTPDQAADALRQVANLAENFGTTYSSMDLHHDYQVEKESLPSRRLNRSPRKL